MKLGITVLILLVVGAVVLVTAGLGVNHLSRFLTAGYGSYSQGSEHSNVNSTDKQDNSTQAPSPTFPAPQGFYVVNSSVYLVYYSPFSQVRIGNVTFIHGGPIMAGYDGVYLVENSTPLNLGEVQFYNGTWFNITLPVFHQGPGMLPRGTLYPEEGVIPL